MGYQRSPYIVAQYALHVLGKLVTMGAKPALVVIARVSPPSGLHVLAVNVFTHEYHCAHATTAADSAII